MFSPELQTHRLQVLPTQRCVNFQGAAKTTNSLESYVTVIAHAFFLPIFKLYYSVTWLCNGVQPNIPSIAVITYSSLIHVFFNEIIITWLVYTSL